MEPKTSVRNSELSGLFISPPLVGTRKEARRVNGGGGIGKGFPIGLFFGVVHDVPDFLVGVDDPNIQGVVFVKVYGGHDLKA